MITTHLELAKAIEGKKILHLNSYGKDAILVLEWLNNFASPSEVVSCHFELNAPFVTDDIYLKYLKKRYPKTRFVSETSPFEMNEKMLGMHQSPVYVNHIINTQEYDSFDSDMVRDETRIKYGCDYLASGMACYEGMGRALYFKRVGLLDEKRKSIFPIGLMKQRQVIDLLKKSGVKLNPSYKFAEGSFDSASYFKMRQAMIARPDYRDLIIKHHPMMVLDEYRFEVLFNGNS